MSTRKGSKLGLARLQYLLSKLPGPKFTSFVGIGIGTDDPDYELDVAGDIGVDEYIYHNDDGDTYIRFAPNLINLVAGGKSALKYEAATGKIIMNNTNQNVDFHVMGDDAKEILATDAANNRVGIGTTAPEAYLDIKNTVDDGETNRTMLRLHNYRSDDADVNDFGPISIDFVIENLDGGTKEGLARIAAVSSPSGSDHTSILGEKTSGLIFSTMNDNTLAEAMRIDHSGSLGIGTKEPGAILEVENPSGSAHPAFLIDNDNVAQTALKVEAANTTARVVDIVADSVTTANVFNINCDARTTGTGFRIYDGATNDSAGSLALITQGGNRAGSAASKGLEINFNTVANANARALYIDSEQTTGVVAEIDATEITTGKGLSIAADALTTGNALYISDNSSDTGTRNTVNIIQDNAAAIAATALTVQSDGGVTGATLDKNYSDTTAATVTGLDIDWDKTGASTSNNTMYGIKLDMDNTTATNGTNYMYGMHVTPTLTHASDAGANFLYGALINAQGGTNGSSFVQGARIEAGGGDINYGIQLDVEDGGVDLRIESSADNGDYFQIQTTTHGATTFTTVDDDATAADLTFSLTGALIIDANQAVAIDSSVASITVGADLTDGQTLKLGKNGAVETIIAPHGTAGSEKYSVTNTAGTSVTEGDAAVQLLATAGGVGIRSTADLANAVNITADGGTASTITIFNDQGTAASDGASSVQVTSDVGRVELLSGLDASKAIYIHADAGTSESIYLHASQGTGQGAITLHAPAGGTYILANKASAYGLYIDNNGGNANRYVIKARGGADNGTGTTHYLYAEDGNGTNVGSIKNVSNTFQLADASDRRLKKNIVDTSINALEIIDDIKVRDFDWIKNDIHCVAGLVAQELQEVFPSAADGSEDLVDPETGDIIYMTVSRDVLVPVLVKAVQELTARIEALEA